MAKIVLVTRCKHNSIRFYLLSHFLCPSFFVVVVAYSIQFFLFSFHFVCHIQYFIAFIGRFYWAKNALRSIFIYAAVSKYSFNQINIKRFVCVRVCVLCIILPMLAHFCPLTVFYRTPFAENGLKKYYCSHKASTDIRREAHRICDKIK